MFLFFINIFKLIILVFYKHFIIALIIITSVIIKTIAFKIVKTI